MNLMQYKIYYDNNMNRTSISLQKETRDKLATLGKKDQTFDQIISDLIEKLGVKE